MIWMVESYKGEQFTGLAISWAFNSEAAAKYWITRHDRPSKGFTYRAASFPIYDLKTLEGM